MSMYLPEQPLEFGGGIMGPPIGPGPPPMAPPEPPDFAAQVRSIIDQVRALAEEGGVTEQERLTVEKITTLVQGLAAGREKEDDALLGGPAGQAIRRAYQG